MKKDERNPASSQLETGHITVMDLSPRNREMTAISSVTRLDVVAWLSGRMRGMLRVVDPGKSATIGG
jgi:hypothetical protein